MSVQPLRPPVVAGWVEVARESIAAAAAVPAGTLDAGELTQSIADVVALESQVGALKLSMLAEVDQRKVAEATGDTDAAAWAAKLTGTTRGVMAGGIWLARLLQDKYDATRAAFAAGGINEAQVRMIVRAAEKLPQAVTDEQRREAEAALVEKAASGMNARRLRQAGCRMLDRISRQLADQHEADQLADEKKKAEQETWFSLHDNEDGTVSGRFTIPEMHGQMLRTMLERLTAPRVLSRNKAGEQVTDPTAADAGGLNRSEAFGQAFLELLEHLPTEGHGAVAATLLVKLDHQHLLDGLAGAGLDTGIRISAGEARRLACGAGIVPVVLGGASEPLDLGRERRLHTKGQRRALSLNHDSCATEGCERPFAWCEIHHPHAWSKGGKTTLGNALPLCGFHHRRAHDDRFTMRFLTSGEVRFRRRS